MFEHLSFASFTDEELDNLLVLARSAGETEPAARKLWQLLELEKSARMGWQE